MEIKIYDYKGDPKVVTLEDKEILCITIKDISGDEVLKIRYKDGTRGSYDSCDSRLISFYDGEYDIFGEEKIEKFLKERRV